MRGTLLLSNFDADGRSECDEFGTMDDPLKKLLEQTGWSYEDVLKRLEQYKQEKSSTDTKSNNCDKPKSTEVTAENNDVLSSATVDSNSKELVTTEHRRKRKISHEAIGREMSPVPVKSDSVIEDTIFDEDNLECKKIKLSSPTDIGESNNNNSLPITESDKEVESTYKGKSAIEERLQSTISKQTKDQDQANVEDKQPESLNRVETSSEYDEDCKNDRLKDTDKIQEEGESKCEDQDQVSVEDKQAESLNDLVRVETSSEYDENCKNDRLKDTDKIQEECESKCEDQVSVEDKQPESLNGVETSSEYDEDCENDRLKDIDKIQEECESKCEDQDQVSVEDKQAESLNELVRVETSSEYDEDCKNDPLKVTDKIQEQCESKCEDQVSVEDKQPESLNELNGVEFLSGYDENCKNDRLKDIDKIQEECESKCEDQDQISVEVKQLEALNELDRVETSSEYDQICKNDRLNEEEESESEDKSIDTNSNCEKITKCKNKRKSNINGDIDNRCCEIIQEDKCDNTFSTWNPSIMKNLTKSLNKRRKLSESNDLNPCSSVSDQNQSLTTNLINDCKKKYDDIFHSSTDGITKSPIPGDTNTDKLTSDETDSNKENTDLDFNGKEHITNRSTVVENSKDSDIPKVSHIPITKEDALSDDVKSRYHGLAKSKNKEILTKDLSQVSDDNKTDHVQKNASDSTSKISESKPIPDLIELLKNEICSFRKLYKQKKEMSRKRESAKTNEDENVQQSKMNSDAVTVDPRTSGDESKPVKSGLSNIISIISKKLKNTEDDNEKLEAHESESSDNSTNQDLTNQELQNHRRQDQILLLKKPNFNSVPSSLKTYSSSVSDIDASTSNSSSDLTSIVRKQSRKFNTDRLTNITNILSQKLSNINKDLDSKNEVSDDDASSLKIVNVLGRYKSPPPDLGTTKAQSRKKVNPLLQGNKLPMTSKFSLGVTACTENIKPISEILSTKANEIAQTSIKEIDVDKTFRQTETAIKPTKTKDVTKIKGWKKKKFAIESPVLKENTEAMGNVATTSFSILQPGPSNIMPCSSTSQTQSVFTSDILEQYLTKNAGLNISYEVPKLDAEQTLQQTYTDIQFPKRDQPTATTEKIKEKKDKKPKTLAEKRKMEERPASRLLEDLLNTEVPTNRHYTAMLLKLKQKMLTENVPFSRKSFVGSSSLTNTESFVLYNNKKIKIPSNKSNKVLCKLFHKEPVLQHRRPKKLSLLKSLSNKGIFYDPKEWEPIEKELPKIYLEFIPTIGKRLHPRVSHLIESKETVLNKQRVNYALSVLKTSVPVPPKRFLFRVPFCNNRKTVSLKRRIVSNDQSSVENLDAEEAVSAEETVEDAVKHVMNKMLEYVDVLDETKDILKEDDVYDAINCTKTKPIQNKGRKKYRECTRTEYEMKRLNCKFVSILTDEESAVKKPCLKDYCRLGCVCKSIEGSVSNLLETHCGLYKCMFQCKCKKEKTQQYSNVFSDCVINRLQDEATKNLAKVEKEFTQTIIQTNNQLIVVGDSTERKKRVPRVPKKYDDFVEEDFFEEVPKIPFTPPKPLKITTFVYNNIVFETCYVKLANYDFRDIIPFCMIHLMYRCHCMPEPTQVATASPVSRASKNPAPVSPEKPEKETSRTKGLPSTVYIVRNKTQAHLMKIQKSSKQLEQQLNKYLKENADHILGSAENWTLDNTGIAMLNAKPQSHTPSTASSPKRAPNKNKKSENSRVIENTKPTAPHQETAVDKELKIQRRRIKQKNVSENRTNQIQQSEKEFCLFLAKHNSQVRILPWSVLLSRYENGSFQLWTLLAPDAPVLLTENGQRPTLTHCNIKVFEHLPETFDPCDIIRFIINKETPLGKSKDQVWVLFLETSKNIWRICGICDKNDSKKDFSISIITLYGRLEDIIKETAQSNSEDDVIITGNKTIVSSKRHYLPKKLLPLVSKNNSYKNNELTIWGSIPNITSSCKWRVISLKNYFSYLSFSRCKYTIEYDDILKAVELTRLNKLTLALRSQDLSRTYPHRKFGVYCDYNHPDKIFVGPYFTHETYDLSFLVFKNNILMDSSMAKDGRNAFHTGYWYRQAAPVADDNADDDVQVISDDTALIDLTTDSDHEQSAICSEDSEFYVVSNTDAIEIDESEIDVDQIDKRYIITNVPAVGYISASINANNYLDIVCPITGKIKTFMHALSTIRILERVLTRKFILVPQSFKLEVTMVDKINTNKFKPLDSSILNGYHMVGQFGVRNASTVTVQELSKFGLTNSEVLQVLEQRERKLLLLPLTMLSKLLNVHIPNKAPFVSSVHKIAEATQNEVERLQNEEANYMDETIQLNDTKKALTKRCLQLVVNLPPDERKREQKRLHKILKSYTSRIDQIQDKSKGTLKATQNDSLDDHLDNTVEIKNLFDDTQLVSKTNTDTPPETLSSAVLQPKRRNIITRTPTKNSNASTNANSEEEPVGNISTSFSAISSILPALNKSLKLINNTALKRKQGKSLLKTSDKKNKLLNTTPLLSKITIPKVSPLSTSTSTPSIKSPSNNKPPQNVNPASSCMMVTLPPEGPISTVKIGKSTYLAHSNQQTSAKFPQNSDAINNSMATVTPLPPRPLKNASSANNQNYIALKQGDRMRYFQLVSEQKSLLTNQSAVITKQPSTVNKKCAKKIILSSALPANTDQKTVT
ncbi:hypothetical protein RN001_003538 [Aquatica leii]|uniref:MGA conserved domain-containing protein n=1 Tax=Aquatica leii TaxID=1421715 RepID=A0AAN7SKU1_9COLE|nr:hypothetical protein RN001_003538 [Aquatica leii]